MSKAVKQSVLKTLLYLIISAATYATIFLNIEQLNEFYLSKHIIPALCLLGTIIFVSYVWGTAASCILRHLGIESDH